MNKKIINIVLIIVLSLSFVSVINPEVFSSENKAEVLEETLMDFEVDVIVKNIGDEEAQNIPLRLALPVEHPEGQYVTKIELSENPEHKDKDEHGNEFVYYTIEKLNPHSEKKYSFNVSLRMLSADFKIQNNKIGKIEKDEKLSRYLTESQYIDINDSEIKKVAYEIANDSNNTFDIVYNTYVWVIDNIEYEAVPGEVSASNTLKSRIGDSAEFGNVFVALLRANGIPARRISGWGHHFKDNEIVPQQKVSHGWAEFYLPNYGWIPADPTFGKSDKFRNFAKANPSHIIMTVGEDIHFLRRSQPESPKGYRDINTDYIIKVKKIENENLSIHRSVITVAIFIVPLIFTIFLIYKKLIQRRL